MRDFLHIIDIMFTFFVAFKFIEIIKQIYMLCQEINIHKHKFSNEIKIKCLYISSRLILLQQNFYSSIRHNITAGPINSAVTVLNLSDLGILPLRLNNSKTFSNNHFDLSTFFSKMIRRYSGSKFLYIC